MRKNFLDLVGIGIVAACMMFSFAACSLSANEQGEKSVKKLQKGLKICTTIQNILPFGTEISKKIMSEVTDKLFGKSVMFCINGGSYLRDEALYLLNGIGYSLHNGYGMSEIGITSVELGRTPKERNKNSIGKPFDSVEYRINESVYILKNTNKKIIDIALDCGFNSLRTFNRNFKEVYGMTPNEYRKKPQPDTHMPQKNTK